MREYDDAEGCSVTGGFVYRGCALPDVHGTYFYGDYCSAFIRSFALAGGVATADADHTAELAPGGGLSIDSIISFGEDARGELYVVDQGGEVFQIIAGRRADRDPDQHADGDRHVDAAPTDRDGDRR